MPWRFFPPPFWYQNPHLCSRMDRPLRLFLHINHWVKCKCFVVLTFNASQWSYGGADSAFQCPKPKARNGQSPWRYTACNVQQACVGGDTWQKTICLIYMKVPNCIPVTWSIQRHESSDQSCNRRDMKALNSVSIWCWSQLNRFLMSPYYVNTQSSPLSPLPQHSIYQSAPPRRRRGLSTHCLAQVHCHGLQRRVRSITAWPWARPARAIPWAVRRWVESHHLKAWQKPKSPKVSM